MQDGKVEAAKPLVPLAILVAYLILSLCLVDDDLVSRVYFEDQDAPVGIVLIILLVVAARWQPGWRLPARGPSPREVAAGAALLALVLWGGTYLVMFDYPLTRDEHMVVFDAHIFGQRALSQPLDPQWRDYALALVPAFLLDVPSKAALVSAYMPGNAAMRALFGAGVDPALMNPLLGAAGLIALHRVAVRLFPTSPGAVWVCLGAYVLSAQVLVNAMTAYAMTAHLTLNLVWLALFLNGRRWAHAGAMLIGAWAIGLHQVIFHPLFAGPFILTLLSQRRWGLFAVYAAVYAAALLAWISYPALVVHLAGIVAQTGSVAGSGGFIEERILPLLTERDPYTLPLMHYNLLRFIAWAPAFVLPLLAFAWKPIRDNEGLATPLACGLALTLVVMAILLPYQGHGWGYRYWHPVLGNAILLCGYGYRSWSRGAPRQADGAVMMLGAATAALLLPWLLATSHQFVAPYVRLTELVERQRSDFVVIDTYPPSNAIDQVRNLPDLSNRPLVFSSKDMTEAQARALCEHGSLTLITRRDFHQVGFVPDLPERSPAFETLAAEFQGRDCLRPTMR